MSKPRCRSKSKVSGRNVLGTGGEEAVAGADAFVPKDEPLSRTYGVLLTALRINA
ncbi:MAG: hypothetical protein ISS31_03980 [Kiritimatiellae bacterium]|nr:hypothetical protein [Kiritimatiellia bacterium]